MMHLAEVKVLDGVVCLSVAGIVVAVAGGPCYTKEWGEEWSESSMRAAADEINATVAAKARLSLALGRT